MTLIEDAGVELELKEEGVEVELKEGHDACGRFKSY